MAIEHEKKGNVAYITINSPDTMNALDPENFVSLKEVLHDFDSDKEMRVAILTGAGEKALCVGANLKKSLPPSIEDCFSSFFCFFSSGSSNRK